MNDLYVHQLETENKQLREALQQTRKVLEKQTRTIDKAIEYIEEYGRDKQLEEDYLMSRYNLANYNITLLEILEGEENE